VKLALGREPDNPLCSVVRESGWEPVSFFCTAISPTLDPPPFPINRCKAVAVLSPSGAEAVRNQLPTGTRVLVQGEGTLRPLLGRGLDISMSPFPVAESMWELIRKAIPIGGDILVVRGERSRGFLETIAVSTPWRIHPWISHREVILQPAPIVPSLDAALALSPIQASILARLLPRGTCRRFAWGKGAARAFKEAGAPAHATCIPSPEGLRQLLEIEAERPVF